VKDERTVAVEIVALMFAVIAGLIARGRWRTNVFFLAYVVNGLAFNLLVGAWPACFYTRASFLVAQLIADILKVGLILEVAYRTFRAFPGAEASTRKVLIAVLVATALTLTVAPFAMTGWDSYLTAIGYFSPLVNAGAIWLTVALLVAARWYRIPVHPFHVAVLTSFACYLAVLSSLSYLSARNGFDGLRVYAAVLEQAVFTLVACWWAYGAWRPETSLVRAYTQLVGKLRFEASSAPWPPRGLSER
jgi:hypothetical protein